MTHNRIGHRFQRRLDVPVWLERGPQGAETYADKVLAAQPDDLLGYWPLWDTAGGVAEDISGNGFDGTYNGAITLGEEGIGDGRTSVLIDTGFINVFSAGLDAVDDQAEMTFMIWARVLNVGVWTDGVIRTAANFWAGVGDGNRWRLQKHSVANRMALWRSGAGTQHFVNSAGNVDTDFVCWVIRVTEAGDRCSIYKNGVEEAFDTGLGAWAGALVAGRAGMGARDVGPVNPYRGWEAHAAYWLAPLAPDIILDLATV